MTTMATRWIGLFVWVSMAASCANPGPQQIFDSYAEAIAHDDPETAYGLMSDEARQKLPYSKFLERWRGGRQALLRSDLTTTGSAAVHAEMGYGDTDRVLLRLGAEGWKISGGLLRATDQSTPRAALATFVRAMQARRCQILIDLAPQRYAQHMSAESLCADLEQHSSEIAELTEVLKGAMDNPITVRATRATMRYGDRTVVFVREGRLWKIDQPDRRAPDVAR